MSDPKALNITHFSQPIRQILSMLLVVVLVAAGAWAISSEVIGIVETNPLLNGFIAGVFLLGKIGRASCRERVCAIV